MVVLKAVRQDIFALKYASLALADGGLCEYVGSLFDAYTVPTYTFLSTIIFASTRSTNCVLWKLGELGEEGGLAIKKDIAAYAGVQFICAELAGLTWSTVTKADLNLANGFPDYDSYSSYGGNGSDYGGDY